jgi:hypothetical protein
MADNLGTLQALFTELYGMAIGTSSGFVSSLFMTYVDGGMRIDVETDKGKEMVYLR